MICEGCGRSNDTSARYCRNCGRTLQVVVEGMPGAGIRAPAPIRFAVGKSPRLALFFSLFPSLGQFYNGDFKRGVLMMFLTAATAPWIPFTSCGSLPFFIAVWAWGAFNAYSVAAGKTALW